MSSSLPYVGWRGSLGHRFGSYRPVSPRLDLDFEELVRAKLVVLLEWNKINFPLHWPNAWSLCTSNLDWSRNFVVWLNNTFPPCLEKPRCRRRRCILRSLRFSSREGYDRDVALLDVEIHRDWRSELGRWHRANRTTYRRPMEKSKSRFSNIRNRFLSDRHTFETKIVLMRGLCWKFWRIWIRSVSLVLPQMKGLK